jgi:rare lipoprotein A (peptidoglycan hydrolase)
MSKKKVLSKKEQAIKIVTRMQARKKAPTRGQILAELQEKAGLSANGAATYYQNVTHGRW